MSRFLNLMKVEPELRPLLLAGDRQVIGTALSGWVESGLTVRVVRGRKMRTLPGVFDEFAAAFQFPLYFGENKDAFDECIADLAGLPTGAGFVVVVVDPDEVLIDAGNEALAWLLHTLESATAVWGQPVELGEWWDRPAVPFHVVLAGQHDDLKIAADRWAAAGAEPMPFARN
jgi:hypothetical protein